MISTKRTPSYTVVEVEFTDIKIEEGETVSSIIESYMGDCVSMSGSLAKHIDQIHYHGFLEPDVYSVHFFLNATKASIAQHEVETFLQALLSELKDEELLEDWLAELEVTTLPNMGDYTIARARVLDPFGKEI